MRRIALLCQTAAVLLVGLGSAACATTGNVQPSTAAAATPARQLEQIHVLMHHGLAMATEGADLVMIAQMGMEPALDRTSLVHGRHSIEAGRELIDLAGNLLDALPPATDPEMIAYTRQLENIYLKLVNTLVGMPAPDPDNEGKMAVHHMHMLLNHALRMASDGANLQMIGAAATESMIEQRANLHGRAMVERALEMVAQVMTGPSMARAHAAGLTEQAMRTTHDLAAEMRAAITLMAQMPLHDMSR